MRLLLDTHILIWALAEPHKIRNSVKNLMENQDNDLLVSSISFYEIQIKRKLGKLSFEYDLNELVETGVFRSLDVNYRHSNYTFNLPLIHHDPFDRMLIAQSIIENIPLITSDLVIQKYDLAFIPA